MTISMYQASIPIFVRALTNLSEVLKKAEASAEARKIDPSVFINARLAPDMFPLSRQIQIATDGVKGCAARLSGLEMPSYEDNETTFAQLQERIAKTIAFAKTTTQEQIDGSEEKDIVVKTRAAELNFKGQNYLLNFVLPNLYFHTAIAYGILRHNGVELGKMDYLGKPE